MKGGRFFSVEVISIVIIIILFSFGTVSDIKAEGYRVPKECKDV